jgi:hypothetical protein
MYQSLSVSATFHIVEKQAKYIGLCQFGAWLQDSNTDFIFSGLLKVEIQMGTVFTRGKQSSRPAQALTKSGSRSHREAKRFVA